MENTYTWYQTLIKPGWAPPSWLFGPVWTILYILIGITFGYVFYKIATRKIPPSLALPFIINLVANVLFTPIQFGLKNNVLAAMDIFIVLVTFFWIYSYKKTFQKNKMMWVIYMNIPYFLWVSFASFLQFTITYLNWR